jgi:hypothetical protein
MLLVKRQFIPSRILFGLKLAPSNVLVSAAAPGAIKVGIIREGKQQVYHIPSQRASSTAQYLHFLSDREIILTSSVASSSSLDYHMAIIIVIIIVIEKQQTNNRLLLYALLLLALQRCGWKAP